MKVDTWQFRFLDETFDVQVHFHPSTGDFVATLPEGMSKALSGDAYDRKVTGWAFKEVRKEIDEMIEKRTRELLDEQIATKVIAYSLTTCGNFEYRVKGRKRDFQGTRVHDGVGLQLEHRVLMKYELRGEVEYKSEDGRKCWLERGEKEVPWTAERESFFNGIEAGLKALVLQVHRFFNQRGEKRMAEMIDRFGQNLLPAPKEPPQ